MKKALLATILVLFPVLVLGTQWSSPELCPGVNDSYNNFIISILTNGTIYELGYGELYRHLYGGMYTWSNGTECYTPFSVSLMTINPSGDTAIVAFGYNLCWATSTDGLTWTWGDIIDGWNHYPEYSGSMSCAWESAEKWLYVVYGDEDCYGAPYPYTSPVLVDFDPNGDHKIDFAGVSPEGNYMVVSDFNVSQLDLYELVGSGSSWSNRSEIVEVNNEDNEDRPVVGVLDGKNILLFSRFGDVGAYDVWYSVGDYNNFSIQPTSLGNIKAIFR
jgi:hypothetical protein